MDGQCELIGEVHVSKRRVPQIVAIIAVALALGFEERDSLPALLGILLFAAYSAAVTEVVARKCKWATSAGGAFLVSEVVIALSVGVVLLLSSAENAWVVAATLTSVVFSSPIVLCGLFARRVQELGSDES